MTQAWAMWKRNELQLNNISYLDSEFNLVLQLVVTNQSYITHFDGLAWWKTLFFWFFIAIRVIESCLRSQFRVWAHWTQSAWCQVSCTFTDLQGESRWVGRIQLVTSVQAGTAVLWADGSRDFTVRGCFFRFHEGIYSRACSVHIRLFCTYIHSEWSEVKVAGLCPTLRPHGLYSPWDSPGWNTGVGSLFLLQGSSQPRDQTQCVTC